MKEKENRLAGKEEGYGRREEDGREKAGDSKMVASFGIIVQKQKQ